MLIVIAYCLISLVPIANIIVGSVYVDKCSIDTRIPIWLIVNGAFGLLVNIYIISYNLYLICKKNKRQRQSKIARVLCCCPTMLVETFLVVWFVCGNVWVFQVRDTVRIDEKSADLSTYCHSTCYLFAFWMIIVTWILVALVALLCILFCCVCISDCLKNGPPAEASA